MSGERPNIRTGNPVPQPVFEEIFEHTKQGKNRVIFILGLLESSIDNIALLTPAIVNQLNPLERLLICTLANEHIGNRELIVNKLVPQMLPALNSRTMLELYHSLAYHNTNESFNINREYGSMIALPTSIATLFRETDEFKHILERVQSGDTLTISEWQIYFFTASEAQFEMSFNEKSMECINKLFDPNGNYRPDHLHQQFFILQASLKLKSEYGSQATPSIEKIAYLFDRVNTTKIHPLLNLSNANLTIFFIRPNPLTTLPVPLSCFDGANLDGAQLDENSVISQVTLHNVSMRSVSVRQSAISDIRLYNTNISNSHWDESKFFSNARNLFNFTHGIQASFDHVTMNNTHWEFSNFTNAKMRSVQLNNCQITSSNFNRADLSKSSIATSRVDTADLSGALFQNTQLANTIFINCNLEAANFQDAQLKKCTFADCNLIDVNFSNISFDKLTFNNVRVLNLDNINSTDDLKECLDRFFSYCQKHRYTGELLHVLREAAVTQLINHVKHLDAPNDAKIEYLNCALSHPTFAHRHTSTKIASSIIGTFKPGSSLLTASQQRLHDAIQELENPSTKHAGAKNPR